MAVQDHLLRFRQKSTADLQALQAKLEAQDDALQQQSMGTKSFTKDTRYITDQLNAIAYVLRERGAIVIVPPPINVGVGIADFGQISSS